MSLSNTLTTLTSSIVLDLLDHRFHHPPMTPMKAWVLPTLTMTHYPFLGDPKPELFGETTLPSISLIGAAAFKWLIDVGEEVYTINIQLNNNYLDIDALQAISHQPAPMSTLHSEPLPTNEAELFTKVIPEAYQDFFDMFSQEEAKNMKKKD